LRSYSPAPRKRSRSRGGERNASYPKQHRLAYFADVYGQMQALKDFVWRFPQLDHKMNVIDFAKKDQNTPWPGPLSNFKAQLF
jgi:hypothetical protein